MLVSPEGRPYDRRPALALIVAVALAVPAALRWPWLGWIFGAVVLLLLLRALALVLIARAAGQPPADDDTHSSGPFRDRAG